jgi:hypothetical protein
MAKKKMGRPVTSDRDDATCKVDRLVLAKARFIAEKRGQSLAEYLTETLRPVVDGDFDKASRG